MIEQWRELKETIIELRDNDGTATQQEVCKFLANYMGVLERQMPECVTINKVLEIIAELKSENIGRDGADEYTVACDDFRAEVMAMKGGEQE